MVPKVADLVIEDPTRDVQNFGLDLQHIDPRPVHLEQLLDGKHWYDPVIFRIDGTCPLLDVKPILMASTRRGVRERHPKELMPRDGVLFLEWENCPHPSQLPLRGVAWSVPLYTYFLMYLIALIDPQISTLMWVLYLRVK